MMHSTNDFLFRSVYWPPWSKVATYYYEATNRKKCKISVNTSLCGLSRSVRPVNCIFRSTVNRDDDPVGADGPVGEIRRTGL